MLLLNNPTYCDLVDRNPGAITVINELCKTIDGEVCLEAMRHNNVYGWQLWFIYKDICKFNIKNMIAKIMADDKAMYARLEKQKKMMELNDKMFDQIGAMR